MPSLSVSLALMTIAISATPAFAQRFSPPGTEVTIAGTLLMTGPQTSREFSCNVIFRGPITRSGKLKIAKATFCHKVQPYALPWIWIATGAHDPPTAMGHMAFSLKNGFDCGTVDSNLYFSNRGSEVVFDAPATSKGCHIVEGRATVSPAIMIVH